MISKLQGHRLLLFIFMGITRILYSQDSIQIHFDPRYYESSDSFIGFMKLFACPNSGSINYNDTTYQFVFPDQFLVPDTAIAFNYFTGWKNPKIEHTTAFLFGNYTSHRPIMYVDYNHNLNFNDDGLPILFDPDSTIVVYLKNSEFPGAFFPIRFFYPKLTGERKSEIETVISAVPPHVSGGKTLGIDYWLGDKRMNYKAATSWLNGNKVKIILYDYNCNGLFDDKEEDRIIIAETDEISGELANGVAVYSDSSQLKIGDFVYDIGKIEPSGRFITLKKSIRPYNEVVGIGDQLTELKIKLLSGDTKTISQIHEKGKYLLLDFWGSWCKGCTQQLPFLTELQESNSGKLQVIGLNFGDTPEKSEKYLSKHHIPWLNGFASDEMIKKLRVDSFPSYLLLDNEGNIVLMDASLEEIKQKITD